MRLVSFSESGGVVKPGFLFEDTGTILDLSPNGFASTLEVITKGSTQAAAVRKVPLDRRQSCMLRCPTRRASLRSG